MKTITVDISECLYYLIPIIVIWIICYRLFLNDFTHCNRLNHEDRIVLFIMSFIMTLTISTIYFIVLYMILNSKFIIQL
jgi:hypothetical protein